MMVLEHAVAAFAPLAVTPQHMVELDAAIEEGTAALRDYLAWRVARRLPIDPKPSLFWCFVAAHAESDAVRLLVLSWLDTMTGPPLPN